MNAYLAAFERHKPAARTAMRAFSNMTGNQLPRVPGMDTIIRLAWRIECGRTIEEASAREYVYRWSLALNSPVFGVPHALGL